MPDPEMPLHSIIDSLPIDRLIGEPLDAMIKAQASASLQYVEFIKGQCIGKDGKAVMMQFDYDETLVDTQGNYRDVVQRTVRVPLMAMVTHPTISLQEGTVDFEMEVTHFAEDKQVAGGEKPPADAAPEPGGGMSQALGTRPPSAVVKGKITHRGEQTRRTDTRARYRVHAAVKRQDAPEAMMRVIDFLTDAATRPVLMPRKNEEARPLPPAGGTTAQGA